MAQKQRIHDERLKRFKKLFMAARFPRNSDNVTPRCMLFKRFFFLN